jgi:2-haloacid dehalogenase
MKLTDFKALTFDCYGTLIDWEAGMIRALAPLTGRLPRPLSRDEILQAHAWHESAQQAATPTKLYPEILAIVYKRLAEAWGVPVKWADCVQYGQSVKAWPAFPDSVASLRYLKGYYQLIILSNVDNESFAASNEKLGVAFDAIYTAQDIGSYKPAGRNFDYMLDHLARLGLGRDDILHTAESLFHDHGPANQAGLASCWIHRRHNQPGFGATMDPGDQPTVNFRFNSLADLVAAHKAELG